MPCCGQIDGTRFMPCLRAALGLPPGGNTWDQNAHAALYRLLSTDERIQRLRGQTTSEIAGVEWGKEPGTTGEYVMGFATTMLQDSDSFWSCLGIDPAVARRQLRDEDGAYYDVALDAGSAASIAEGGEKLGGGVPTWILVLGILGALGVIGWLIWR